jgi:hypothetical protein
LGTKAKKFVHQRLRREPDKEKSNTVQKRRGWKATSQNRGAKKKKGRNLRHLMKKS